MTKIENPKVGKPAQLNRDTTRYLITGKIEGTQFGKAAKLNRNVARQSHILNTYANYSLGIFT